MASGTLRQTRGRSRHPGSGRNGRPTGLRGGSISLHRLESGGGVLHVRREVGHFLHLPDLDDFIVRRGAPRRPGDRLLARGDVDHPVAAEHLLGLDEGAVDHQRLAAGKGHPRAHRRRMQTAERDQHARILQFLIVCHHGGHGVRIRHGARRGGFIALRNHQHHESHRCSSSISARWPCSGLKTKRGRPSRHSGKIILATAGRADLPPSPPTAS